MKSRKKNKHILMGVCGGIASYKSCALVRLLVKNGFAVKVMMTEAATKFVTPLTFQELSQHPVYLEMFTPLDSKHLTGFTPLKEGIVKHVSLAEWADLCVVAPLSANTLSKIAQGICDNLLTTVICALPQKTKVLLAPGMNEQMWKNPIIQENVSKLTALKNYVILPPEKGELACGTYGEGRMAEIEEIYKKIC